MSERIRVAGLAIVSAVVFFFIATGLFNANLMIGPESTDEMTIWNVLIFTVAASALAILLATILDRFSWGRTAWSIVALVVLGASIFSVFGLNLDPADIIWQSLLHAVFGLLLIVGFYVGWPPPRVR